MKGGGDLWERVSTKGDLWEDVLCEGGRGLCEGGISVNKGKLEYNNTLNLSGKSSAYWAYPVPLAPAPTTIAVTCFMFLEINQGMIRVRGI